MNYLLENLGPERFQEFCHALLAKAFPKLQCFPVGQRDGGRDAVSYYLETNSREFIVFQVKFVRKPEAEKDTHEWIKKVMQEEAPKVERLIPKGAKEYYLLTNVSGTAFPDSGSIDSVQETLNKSLSIPAQCWWRDDINRRLDESWGIKWSYPEILTGQDVIRFIIERGLNEDAERRASAVRAFVRDQFERDVDVRFKQVELQNKLLDLFIDVPISVRGAEGQRGLRREAALLNSIVQEAGNRTDSGQERTVGAATFILNPESQRTFTRIVIEGAPGQGKSTISQYVCQIHRGRILQEGMDDPRIPARHRRNPVRLPFKIDCRDFSLWLSKKDPFSSDENADPPDDWQKSLEGFLAAQVHHYSGGAKFVVSDLHAVLRVSAVLVVFDGLDEVADISRRREVIEQIVKGSNRLHDIAVSAQTVVTSRPAAFANSPGLPEESFRHFHLASIDRNLIDDYAAKWLKARKLDGKEASDVRRILRDKLDQPHIRELSRNPMQLAILLSLVQTRGGSLPDKRTALYDNYVQLFFNRESEKSNVVRDHRELLIDIHQYLGWVLHAESQTKRNRGSVSSERLQQLVESYLLSEGHETSLASQLFTGMVERVVALVSRVEGTYEFEVQPLREYFAAKHLYCTAPYSPAGNEMRGTLPDRFDALCRDFYWLNVTRFYSGCYSKGELPSLVERLEELSRSDGYRDTSHPRVLAATLLADWVFAQHPKAMRQVVGMILDGIGLTYITSGGPAYRRDEPLVLPKSSGSEELVERCFGLLAEKPAFDFAWMLLELIRANAGRETINARWLEIVSSKSGGDRTAWINYGMQLGVLSVLTPDELEGLLSDGSDRAERMYFYVRAGQAKYIEAEESRLSCLIDYFLDTPPRISLRRARSHVESFAQALMPQRYAVALENRYPNSLSELLDRFNVSGEEGASGGSEEWLTELSVTTKMREVTDLAAELSELSALEWATKLDPWSRLVERVRTHFGEKWSLVVLANVSAGIRSKDELCEEATSLFDAAVPLCRRVRYARLRAGSAAWWESQIKGAGSEFETSFGLLVLLTWAGPTVLEKLSPFIDERLHSLEGSWWVRLSGALRWAGGGIGHERKGIKIALESLPAQISERTVVALSFRLNSSLSHSLFINRLRDYAGDDYAALEFCQLSALRAAQGDPSTWREWLPVISKSYAKGVVTDVYVGYRFARAVRDQELPMDIAKEIVRSCGRYPVDLVAWAEIACRQAVAAQVRPVGEIAESQKWFQ